MSEGWLSTHILDTANGCPAAGVVIRLFAVTDAGRSLICETVTNSDGRTDQPLLPKGKMKAGTYELEFEIGAYFKIAGDTVPFINQVPIRFGIADADEHYHVPLLVSPYSYSTYRGS